MSAERNNNSVSLHLMHPAQNLSSNIGDDEKFWWTHIKPSLIANKKLVRTEWYAMLAYFWEES